MDVNTRGLMADSKFFESYSRFIESEGRYETWAESVERVMATHRIKYKKQLASHPALTALFDEVQQAYTERLVLGSQRALQFGGEQLLKHEFRLYNCVKKTTRFVTSEGIKSFEDFSDGDRIVVLTHTGKWKPAIVRSHGQQSLNEITLERNSVQKKVFATENHRWILSNGDTTEDLKIGDRLLKEPNIFGDFCWSEASPEEQLYWCYGFVYGDGTLNNGYSMVRLCNEKNRYLMRFESLGFKSSSSHSLEGDSIVYTGKYQKTLPDPMKDSPEMIRAFVRGYMDADGNKNNNAHGKMFWGIQASNEDAIEFIRNVFPVAGINIISEKDKTGQETNYGTRPYTVSFTTSDSSGSKYQAGWKVISIRPSTTEQVWCLDVEDDHSFVLEGGIVTGNCLGGHANNVNWFGEYFYLLLCGCGVGASVQKHHVAQLPMIRPRTKQAKTHVVEDSIEGWATAVDVLMSSFFMGGGKYPEYEGRKVFFDTTRIRDKGAHISGGFKAPGPEPLQYALNQIERLLVSIAEEGILRPIHVYDIGMWIADAVLSGGVRRAATIFLFSKDDLEMMNAKIGDWFVKNPQRARSNNSAVCLRSELTEDEFKELIAKTREFGEPGFVFVDDLEYCFNPCLEIGFYPISASGEHGFQACNLCEMNGNQCDTAEDFYRACRVAAILGTIQAGYTNFKFVSAATKEIIEREALLGISLTGWLNNPKVLLDPEVMRKGAEIVKATNKYVAGLLGINQAARTTCVKPAGNASVLLGTASGVHAEHSKRYLRTVQMNKIQEVAEIMRTTNSYMVEDSVWSQSKSDYAISFPIIAPKGSTFKKDLNAITFLDIIKSIQVNWVEAGTNHDLCVSPKVRHNVSNTVTVRDEEWPAVIDYIYANRDYFTGISLLSSTGSKDYHQAPYNEVYTESEIVKMYGPAALFASGLIVDAAKGFSNLWEACSIAMSPTSDMSNQEIKDTRSDWIRRFHKFAVNHFDGDLKQTSYCLKDVYLLYRWQKIQQNFVDPDLEGKLKVAKAVDIDTMGAISCSAGGCEF